MKKLLLIFFTLLSLHSIGQGTFTANGDLAPTGGYPITRFGSAQTGYWPLTHLADRDAIPLWQRTFGMMVYVKDVDSTYTLKSATLDNSNWMAFKQGSIDMSNLVKYSDTASLSNRIDFNTTNLNIVLGSYVVSQRFLDSLANIRSSIDLKLNTADTASLSNRIDQKFAISDTALLGNRISLKLDKNDTASLSNRINQRVLYTDSTTTFITVKQLRDSLALIQSGTSGGGVSLNVDRPITRLALTGGVTGVNLGTGKTVSQFLDAFFFPALAATPPTITFTTPTNTFAYSAWKSWTSFNTTINFGWSLTNLSKSDATDDKAITSIQLLSNASTLATAIPDNTIVSPYTQNGTFLSVPFNTSGNKTAGYNQTYTLQVVDAQPNTVSKSITLTASPAIALTVSGVAFVPTVASNTYEYTPADKTLSLAWTVTKNDENIASQAINGTTGASSPQNVIFPIASASKIFNVTVIGDIYSSGVTVPITATWANRLYNGVITSAVPPRDPTFTFTSAQTIALGLPANGISQLGGNWKSASGYSFTCASGGQYVAFAYPSDNVTPTVQYWDNTFSSWMTYPASDLQIMDQPFTNQFGYTSATNYKYVFVNVQYKSATMVIRLQ